MKREYVDNQKSEFITPGFVGATVLIVALFAFWGMSNSLNDVLIPQFKKTFLLGDFASSFVQFATFIGYFVFAIPASLFMRRFGYRAAVAESFGMRFTGLIAYAMWMFIHNLYLIGWGNRLGTIYTWLRALVFTKDRGHRIITYDQAHNRLAKALTASSGGTAAVLPPRSPDELPTANPAGGDRLSG